ncbi:type VI secretion system-associated protein [Gammaproteobacteria bacterium 45_16_T64]|mgnify:CR=1 FL=1|nr:type VI secretion system-associated protein [Gammaproteobacteria bacterium 45_16_T64]
MSQSNKVVWSEGMFLRPQHFQQQDRYFERIVDARCNAVDNYGWGFQEISVDQDLLKVGKISLRSASGVLPDGTPFNLPQEDNAPDIIDIPENVHNEMVYLAIPLRRAGSLDVTMGENPQGLARYHSADSDVRDAADNSGDLQQIQLGALQLKLLRESEDLSGYACLGVCRIIESREDKQVILDDQYIVSCVDIKATARLSGFLSELVGLLHHRGEALGSRLADSGRAGSAEVADYMLLQLVNRLEPLTIHLSTIKNLHPLALYTELVQMAGELSTFTSRSKRPAEFAHYLHDQLQETYVLVLQSLRQNLSMVLEQTAVSLELAERKYGIRVSPINDRSLVNTATFVLAVKSDLPDDELRSRFPAQIKIGPVEKIRQLVNAQLAGIGLRALPVAPRQIPYHAGYTYFELDRSSEYWRDLQQSGGFAVHVGGDFPSLEIEFWAVRE